MDHEGAQREINRSVQMEPTIPVIVPSLDVMVSTVDGEVAASGANRDLDGEVDAGGGKPAVPFGSCHALCRASTRQLAQS